MEQTKNREVEIDLGKIFYKMRNKFIFIIIITIIAAIVTGLVTTFAIKPTYSATVKMYVYSNTDRVSTDSSITANELDASQELVNTYLYILKSDTVLESVIKDLNLKVSSGALRGAIDARQAENTVAFEVTVNTKDPKLSAKIANSIAKIAPGEIVRVVKAGGVEIIDYAKVPKRPSSPNLSKNVLIATVGALAISFVLFFVYEVFDTTITGERDIVGTFDIPILGTVPNLDNPLPNAYSQSSSKSIEAPNVTTSGPSKLIVEPSSQMLEDLQNMKGEDK